MQRWSQTTHWRLLTATIVALMIAAFVVPRWIRAPGIRENRVPASRPALPTRIADLRAFSTGWDLYLADHFPVRPHLIGLLNRLRMLAGTSGSSRVIIGRDGWLFYDDDTHLGAARGEPALTSPEIRTWMTTLAGRTEYARAHGATYLVVTPPVKETIYPQYAPRWAHVPNPERPTVVLPRLAAAADIGEVLSLYPEVAAATLRGEPTYSRHDTHWTGYGAYAGYVLLMRRLHALGLADEPLPRSAFTLSARRGDQALRDLALMLGVASLVDINFVAIDNPNGRTRMRTTFLSDKQDWTSPQVIDTGETGKPVLMLTRDSFSNELLPLLLPHFSRIVLSHLQDGLWRADLIDRFKPDIIVLEVIESGLRAGVSDGAAPSAAATARIDRVMATLPKAAAPATSATPTLPSTTARLAATIAAATVTPNCNLEVATMQPGRPGETIVTLSGWISELGSRITSAEGLVAVQGAGLHFATPIHVDSRRADVAAYFKVPTGEESGFLGTYSVAGLPPGDYTASVYRRSPDGWIGCTGKQILNPP